MIEDARDIGRLLAGSSAVTDALRDGARRALREHQESGLPLAIWHEGRVVWVSPDEFERGLIAASPQAGSRRP